MSFCMKQARLGDAAAKEALVNSLHPRISKMARYYARRCGEDPDDLLQEAWVGLLEALPGLDLTIGSPEQYLIQRARWRVLDAVKYERIRRCASLEDETVDLLLAPCVESGLSSACALEFVGRLKSTQRRVLKYLLEGLTWRDVGDILGCTSANVAYYVRQIRQEYEMWAAEPVAADRL